MRSSTNSHDCNSVPQRVAAEGSAILPQLMQKAAAWGTGPAQGNVFRQRMEDVTSALRHATPLGEGGAPSEVLGSHFGAQALQGSISALSDWVMSSLSWAEASEPGSLSNLSGALGELKQATQLLTRMPGQLEIIWGCSGS